MGRCVAVYSMGTCLCLLYLLEGWLASSLAFAATLDLAAAVRGHLNGTRKIKVKEDHLAKIYCQEFVEHIHIVEAKWGASNWLLCRKKIDKTHLMRSLCDNKDWCRFIPSSVKSDYNDDPMYVNLGYGPCPHHGKTLTGKAECWDSCKGIDCGNGVCVRDGWDSYDCSCRFGYVNRGGVETLPCVKSKCEPNPCGSGECELLEGNSAYICHCPSGAEFASGTCKAKE